MSTTKRKRKSTKKSAPTASEGNNVKVHYKGTLNDGTVFDSSYDRNETIEFTVGSGQMIPGFDAAVNGMTVGEKKTVNLEVNEAYGERIDEAVREVPKTSFPEDFEFETGVVVEGSINGNQVRGSIEEVSDESVIIDFNHPMAGQPLNFEIELVEIGE